MLEVPEEFALPSIRMRIPALLLLIALLAEPQTDTQLTSIHEILAPMRKVTTPGEARGAGPEFTVLKHMLRDWIESRLPELNPTDHGWSVNPVVLQERLNEELKRADLFCWPRSNVKCPEWWSSLGSVSPLHPVLQVRTGWKDRGGKATACRARW